MGACYSVTIDVSFKDEQAAIKVLQEKVKTITYMQKDLDKVDINTFDGLMKLYLANHQNKVDIDTLGNRKQYSNGFNATYSWESVLADMFMAITPFLKDGSEMEIYPDSGCVKYLVSDGKCISEMEEDEEDEEDE